MEKQDLLNELNNNHQLFIHHINSLSEADYNYAPQGKWSAGQQLDHIIKAVDPLVQAFLLPEFVFKLMFGKANRPSKTYEGLVAKYKEKLAAGGRASGPFIPPVQQFADKQQLINKLNKKIDKLSGRASGFSESQMDRIIIPHPLLGKVTMREMLYFTAYHVLHHDQLVKQYLAGK